MSWKLKEKERLFKYIKDFGFGVKTGVDLNGEGSGIIFDVEDVGDLELATTAFGQGVSVTPIQQIVAVSAAINGGTLYKPYIVKSINEPETNTVVMENKPRVVRQVIKSETSEKVRAALENVVSLGTGRNAYIEGYRVGGKTGTAQKVSEGKYMVGNYIVSFMGFLPANDPKVIVYVAVDNAKGITQYGGTIAAPIARSILLSSIDALNIGKVDNGVEMRYTYLDKKYYDLPNVVGMDVSEARKELKKFKIEYSGTGTHVIYQSPSGGKLKEGETVRLLVSE